MSRVTFHLHVLLVLLLYLNLTINLKFYPIKRNLYTGSNHIISTAEIVPHISIWKLDFHLGLPNRYVILSKWVIDYSIPCFHCWILPWSTCKAGCVACVEPPTSIVMTCTQNFINMYVVIIAQYLYFRLAVTVSIPLQIGYRFWVDYLNSLNAAIEYCMGVTI